MSNITFEWDCNATPIENFTFGTCENEIKKYIGSGLSEVIIPEGITEIAGDAFVNCIGLKRIVLPNSLRMFTDFPVFSNCYDLEEVEISTILDNYTKKYFNNCINVKFTEENGIKYWGNRANPYVNAIDVTDKGAQYLTVAEGTLNIANYAFEHCDELLEVTLPDSLENLSADSFANCGKLEHAKVPDTIKHIAPSAFIGCNKLVYGLSRYGEVCYIHSKSNNRFALCKKLRPIVGTFKIDENTEMIMDNAFQDEKLLEQFEMGDKVKTIGENAFAGCNKLKKIKISNSLEKIGMFAFKECESLTQINIPGTLKGMGRWVFYNAKGLKTLVFEEGITSINDLGAPENLTNVFLPEGLKEINYNAFAGCKSLKTIYIPSSVDIIKEDAFKDCANLSIKFEASVPPINLDPNWNPNNCSCDYGVVDDRTTPKEKETHIADEKDYGNKGLQFLSFICPLIGIILFLVWIHKKPRTGKKCLKWAIIGAIVYVILYFVVLKKYL